ncbi:short-chain dehydrogenase [Streptomyces sp. WAC 01529]|uniref:SDR family oxidoreductase n=1 Tax=Streptomyces sp. WAC 01529 TaxID=2203205 RepID=UPI000F6F9FE7|nr:SDR family oxidoreductase [Streptomyces sp. WAC 01529]AZM57844.1 short-chain dehydrogenase [Streptomyces sp. WAC 01529]
MTDPGRLGLAGRTALVTGGTRGVGLAIARKLCAEGCRVVVNHSRPGPEAERAVAELTAAGGDALAIRADVREPAALDRLLAEVKERFGRLDVFVHNAATFHPSPAVGADRAGIAADLALALDPLLHGAPALAELMAGGAGRVVAVSSSGARSAVPMYVGQGLAKAALESLVRYLAVELAGRGIAVNAVSTAKIDKGAEGSVTPRPEVAAALAARTPAGRLTRPEDVADVVALLCTDEAGWIHGQVITADGGLGLRG